MQERVSIYKNITDVQGKETSLQAVLHAIKNGRWKEQITKLRNIKDEKEQKAYKNTLPCFTGSGVFSSRKSEGLATHSNIMILDIDFGENPVLLGQFEEIRQKLIADKYTCFLFVSCRGSGLAVGVKIQGERHTGSFQYLERYYKDIIRKNLGLQSTKVAKMFAGYGLSHVTLTCILTKVLRPLLYHLIF